MKGAAWQRRGSWLYSEEVFLRCYGTDRRSMNLGGLTGEWVNGRSATEVSLGDGLQVPCDKIRLRRGLAQVMKVCKPDGASVVAYFVLVEVVLQSSLYFG